MTETNFSTMSPDVMREFLWFMTGDHRGGGSTRQVYDHPHDPTKIIKIENSRYGFQNVREWQNP